MAKRFARASAVGILILSFPVLYILLHRSEEAQDGEYEETLPPTCRFPHHDPKDRSTMRMLREWREMPPPLRCRADALSLSRVLDRVLYVDTAKLARIASILHPRLPSTALRCCVSSVSRGPPPDEDAKRESGKSREMDGDYTLSPCRPFVRRAWLTSEFVVVRCRAKGEELYRGVHSSVRARGSWWKRPIVGGGKEDREEEGWVAPTGGGEGKEEEKEEDRKGAMPSVFVLGIDSTSRLNSMRFLSKTRATLAEAGAFEMTMYNKVGENTLPNLFPILTGISLEKARSGSSKINKRDSSAGVGCWPSRNHTFDRCPFLWRTFSSQGYATLFAEDEPDISTFNYHRPGFSKPPADFYLRPFFLAASHLLPVTSRNGMSVCFGARPTTEILLDYSMEFVRWAAARGTPFFGVAWTSNLSHQEAAGVSLADKMVAKFVKEVSEVQVEGGLLLIVLSDHGMRWGPLRESPSGWHEERTPFLFIKSHKKVSPNKSPLAINSRRLVSPFDIHSTLSALLPGRWRPASCPGCVDLLNEVVPWNRTCEDASIPEEWCACGGETGLSALPSSVARGLSSVALDAVNEETAPYRNVCAFLSLSRVEGLRLSSDHVLVRFVVTPGEGAFEGRLRGAGGAGGWRVVGSVSRINLYGDSSACIDDPHIKSYCYCV